MDKTIKQAVDEFNADDYDNALSDESRLEKKRADFVDHFSLEYIKSMDIDEYVIGTGAKNTFCYRLEHELDGLGSVSTPARVIAPRTPASEVATRIRHDGLARSSPR